MSALSRLTLPIAAALALAACSKTSTDNPAPPRSNSPIKFLSEPSLVAIPIEADISQVYTGLEHEIPRTLWTIDQPGSECVPSQTVKVVGVSIKSPKIKCRLVGRVTRGDLKISGRGRDLIVTMPIHAVIEARDIAGVLKRETATADAQVRAVARLRLERDWRLGGTVDIEYDWTAEPTIDFLGQKIVFTSKADEKLKRVVAWLERTLPRELGKVNIKGDVERLWTGGFSVLELNRKNPPVWLRLTPQEVGYGGYTLRGKRITVDLGLKATTLTFVGDKPEPPQPTALPPPGELEDRAGHFSFNVPVIADYTELEPVIAKALGKRQQRPFDVPGVGPVAARFGKVTVYGTDDNRMAVGVQFSAQDVAKRLPSTSGTVWLVGRPVNDLNSREVRIADFDLSGATDSKVVNLLAALAATPDFKNVIASSLSQNFTHDFDDLMGKIDRALAELHEGNLVVKSRIETVETGRIRAAGRGLFLPVRARGTTRAELRPTS